MGRGNAVERAAQAKAKLEAANKAQAEIAKQAVEALDNGADPELVAKLAEEAAKEIKIESELTPVLQGQQDAINASAVQSAAQIEMSKRHALEELVGIKLIDKNMGEGKSFRMDIGLGDGSEVSVDFNENGEASVPESVGKFMLENFVIFTRGE